MKEKFKRMTFLGSIYSVGGLLQRLTAFILIPVYTYFLTTKDYGIIGLMGVTITFASLIISSTVGGFQRHYYAPEYADRRKELTFNCLIFAIGPSIICAALFYSGSYLFAKLILGDPTFNYIIKIYAFILISEPVMQLFFTLLRLQEKVKAVLVLNFSQILLSAFFTIYLLVVKKMGILALIYGRLFGNYAILLISIPFFIKNIKPKYDFKMIWPSMRYGYASFFAGFSQFVIQSADRYILRIYSALGTVGLYSFGYNFAGALATLIVMPLKGTFEPMAYKMENKPEELREFTSRACIYYYIIALFLCLVLSMFIKEILRIMVRKKEFMDAWPIVPIIAYSYVLHGLGIFFSWGMVMRKKGFLASMVFAAAAVTNIGFNFLLIPHYGIMGAAFATLISYIVWNILKVHYSAKLYDLHFDLWRLGHISIVGIGLYLGSLFIANTRVLAINIILKFIILLLYPVLLFITGFFIPTEKTYIQKFIANIRKNGLRKTYAMTKETR